ncbi:hypothetical protein DW904_16750 [Ruminococcus sp. AM42-11]|uniref:hypothetical protein n=1 Tax=Ruminococcus sp. AM42-11 TaxID=2292372 RepID=UPI000E4CE5CC|nr:hypothetical protein [Ruminococcus sp. AM42-11]RHS96721.1 hypothetical protein DW904_16750 [Ruminococcus sp. AM42-11]
MEDYIGARVDYEPKYKDVLPIFRILGIFILGKLILGMKLVNRGQKHVTFMQGLVGLKLHSKEKMHRRFSQNFV